MQLNRNMMQQVKNRLSVWVQKRSEWKHYLRVDLHHLQQQLFFYSTGSIFYTRETEHLSESQCTAAVLYTVRGPAIAATLNGIFGGWIAHNRCNSSASAESSKLRFTFQTMTKCPVSAVTIYVSCNSSESCGCSALAPFTDTCLVPPHVHTLSHTHTFHTVTL